MTKDEALKMAIERLIKLSCLLSYEGGNGWDNPLKEDLELINACKEALEQPAQEPDGCGNCHACLVNVKTEQGWPATATRMIVCPECGNKRCPKASNHRYDCTNSNDVGQLGSIYTHSHQWQGLTDDDVKGQLFGIRFDRHTHTLMSNPPQIKYSYTMEERELFNFARAIEQASRSKNSWLD
jgi:hypothetical protein